MRLIKIAGLLALSAVNWVGARATERANVPPPVYAPPAQDIQVPPIPPAPTLLLAPARAVKDEEWRIKASRSLLAATYNAIVEPPKEMVTVDLTCLVIKSEGVPLSCLPAAALKNPKTWAEYKVQEHQFMMALPTALAEEARTLSYMTAAADRILSSRLHPDPAAHFDAPPELINFSVEISPTDALPDLPLPVNMITQRDVKLENDLNSGLFVTLYPSIMLFSGTEARVVIVCNVLADRTLSCQRSPRVTILSGPSPDEALWRYFRYASYQAASTIKLQPKTITGADVVGQTLVMNFRWQRPSGLAQSAGEISLPLDIRQSIVELERARRWTLPPVTSLPREEALKMISQALVPDLQRSESLAQVPFVALELLGRQRTALVSNYPDVMVKIHDNLRSAWNQHLSNMDTAGHEMMRKKLAGFSDSQMAMFAFIAKPPVQNFDQRLPAGEPPVPVHELSAALSRAYVDRLLRQPKGKDDATAFIEARRDVQQWQSDQDGVLRCALNDAMQSAITQVMRENGDHVAAKLMELNAKGSVDPTCAGGKK